MSSRAERLGAAMLVCGLVREPAHAAILALEDVPLLSIEEWEAWRDLDDVDLALLGACLEVEFELRDREWAALDRLGWALSTGEGETQEERVAGLSLEAALIAAASMAELGWVVPPSPKVAGS